MLITGENNLSAAGDMDITKLTVQVDELAICMIGRLSHLMVPCQSLNTKGSEEQGEGVFHIAWRIYVLRLCTMYCRVGPISQ